MARRPRLSCVLLLATTTCVHALAAAKRRKPSKPKTSEPDYVDIQEGDVAWQCESVVQTLKSGGVGVIPTDTGYAFCARVNEKDAVRRLLDIKGADSGKKPLALLSVHKSKCHGAFALNRRVDLHAIDATPAR